MPSLAIFGNASPPLDSPFIRPFAEKQRKEIAKALTKDETFITSGRHFHRKLYQHNRGRLCRLSLLLLPPLCCECPLSTLFFLNFRQMLSVLIFRSTTENPNTRYRREENPTTDLGYSWSRKVPCYVRRKKKKERKKKNTSTTFFTISYSFPRSTSSYYRGAHGIIVVYDITNQKSFSSISKWLKEIEMFAGINVRKLLVGNKLDKAPDRVITTEQGQVCISPLLFLLPSPFLLLYVRFLVKV